MNVALHNSNQSKLQGVAYYIDCYKFWDLNHCAESFNSKSYERSVVAPLQSHPPHPYQGEMAVIDFSAYNSFDSYFKSLSPNVKRDISLCENKKFYFKKYDFNSFIPDFLSINKSQNKIKGGINKWYLNDVSCFKGSHSNFLHEWENEHHYSMWFGVFKYLKNYKQESDITNEKLFAYCKLAVDGEMATITLIWGHAEFLSKGIMFFLLSNIVRECFNFPSVRLLVYYGYGQYGSWKKRLGFRPQKISLKL